MEFDFNQPPYLPRLAHSAKCPTLPGVIQGPHVRERSTWSSRYGERHRLVQIKDLPAGITAPKRIRIYRRRDHYVLQWWDPAAKGNLSERVDGDLVAAISRARTLDERVTQFRSSSVRPLKRMDHSGLVSAYLADLQNRADAGEVTPPTVTRYAAALGHYQAFCELPTTQRTYPQPARVNRDFRLRLEAFLGQRQVSLNGRSGENTQVMKSKDFVLNTIRAMFEWAHDPEHGNLMPEGFHNPFLRLGRSRTTLGKDPFAQPDISLSMAIDLICACDEFQLRLFVPILLFGLRAAEPVFLFAEYLDSCWLRVPCLEDLGYLTKGQRDKRFPLLNELAPFWRHFRDGKSRGLLLNRRSSPDRRSKSPLAGCSLAELTNAYRTQTAQASMQGALSRLAIRNRLIHDAGGLTYDLIQAEFQAVASRLGWPRSATLKDLRHLFATTMNNASMPEPYRRYLMGHSQGRAAIGAYTHLNELERHYQEAVRKEWSPLIEAIQTRTTPLAKAS